MRKQPGRNGSCKVTFELPAEVQATEPHVCGEFNEWSTTATPMKRRKDGTFAATVTLEAGRRGGLHQPGSTPSDDREASPPQHGRHLSRECVLRGRRRGARRAEHRDRPGHRGHGREGGRQLGGYPADPLGVAAGELGPAGAQQFLVRSQPTRLVCG